MASIQDGNKSKNQITNLLNYMKKLGSESKVQEFAEKCGTTKGNLLQIAYGGSVSPKLSKNIHEHSGGAIQLTDLRPDIFS